MLDQQFDEGTLHILREAVLAHAAAAGMPEWRAVDVMLAVHELAANAVRHGGGTGQVQVQVADGALVCRVSDPGPASRNGHAPATEPGRQQPRAVTAQPWPYQPGHGLWLVRQAADHLTVTCGPAGSQVTAVFALAPAGVAGDGAGPGPVR